MIPKCHLCARLYTFCRLVSRRFATKPTEASNGAKTTTPTRMHMPKPMTASELHVIERVRNSRLHEHATSALTLASTSHAKQSTRAVRVCRRHSLNSSKLHNVHANEPTQQWIVEIPHCDYANMHTSQTNPSNEPRSRSAHRR